MVIYFAISIEINTFAHVNGRVQEDGMCIEGTIGVCLSAMAGGTYTEHLSYYQDSCLPATDSKTPL